MILVVEMIPGSVKLCIFKSDGSSRDVFLKRDPEDPEILRKDIRKLAGRSQITAISFRILFGGDRFHGPSLISPDILSSLEKLTEFFPIYLPFAIKTIGIFQDAFKGVPLIAFFEHSFFRNLPDEEKYYALPVEYCEDNRIRKWGFHGIFHEANAKAVPAGEKTISVVFDTQTTVCALRDREPLSISLGYTPLEGVMSKTSSGDLDPGIVLYLMNVHKYSLHRIDDMLKNESGFFGLTGYDIRMEDMIKLRGRDKKVDLAFDIYISQIMKYIGEGISVLGGLDNIIFSGGNVDILTSIIHVILKNLMFLGVNVESFPWDGEGEVICVSSAESNIKAFINKMNIAKIIFLQS